MKQLTAEQKQSIANYKKAGIEITISNSETVIIEQKRLINGYILNQKELHQRAREVFPTGIIKTIVFSLDVDTITTEWINTKMEEFGIKRNDLIKQLAFDKSTLSLLLSGGRGLTKSVKATFFYYFLTYELNRDFRDYLNKVDKQD